MKEKRKYPLTEGNTRGNIKHIVSSKRPTSPPPPMKPKKFNRVEELKRFIGSSNVPLENPTPINHNKDAITLQFNGWSIDFRSDGSFIVNDTSGG